VDQWISGSVDQWIEVKARRGMQMDGTTLGLAPEGSFTAGFGIALQHTELRLFIDDERNRELVESVLGPSPVSPRPRDHQRR
jgi:hypothetical protein